MYIAFKLTPETLRELCIKNHWFTHGSNYQYDKLFELSKNCGTIDELAAIIWACSEDVTGTLEQIKTALKVYHTDRSRQQS